MPDSSMSYTVYIHVAYWCNHFILSILKKIIGPAPSTPVPKDEKQRDTDSDSGISGKNTALDNRFSHFYME